MQAPLIYLKISLFLYSKSGLSYFLPGAEYFLLLLKTVAIQDILQVQGAFSTSQGQYLCQHKHSLRLYFRKHIFWQMFDQKTSMCA